MTPFQWIFCSLLALLVLWEIARLRRGASTGLQWLARSSVWVAALVAIAEPLLVTKFANAIGIGRGADVVLYVFVLAFLGASFAFYSRSLRLERQITSLVGHVARLEARRGPTQPGQEPPRA